MLKLFSRIIITATLAASMAWASAPATFTGVLTDSMCTKKHMMPGKDDGDCVRACAKGGAAYALVSGKTVYELQGARERLDSLAGKKIVVKGVAKGKVISVTEASVAE